MISIGQNFSLTIDRGYTRYIHNRGTRTYMNTSDIHALYIGGIPNELTGRALQLWHIREATSFQGNRERRYDDTVGQCRECIIRLERMTLSSRVVNI